MTDQAFFQYAYWARAQFAKFRSCVAYIETHDSNGASGVGTCFHVGNGVFVTARHVIEDRSIESIGFDDYSAITQLARKPKNWDKKSHGSVSIKGDPYFHPNKSVDVACFSVEPYPESYIPLGGHLWLGQYELVLHRTLVLGYPRIPLSLNGHALVASIGEINAVVETMLDRQSCFIVSTMARGGFSGGPALVAYDERNEDGGTAALGMVTQSLVSDNREPELGYLSVITVNPIYECLDAYGLLPEYQRIDEDRLR